MLIRSISACGPNRGNSTEVDGTKMILSVHVCSPVLGLDPAKSWAPSLPTEVVGGLRSSKPHRTEFPRIKPSASTAMLLVDAQLTGQTQASGFLRCTVMVLN